MGWAATIGVCVGQDVALAMFLAAAWALDTSVSGFVDPLCWLAAALAAAAGRVTAARRRERLSG